jgi:predicted permease
VRLLHLIRGLLRRLVRRRQADQALDEELQTYVDLLADEHARAGLNPEGARRAALVETGGVQQIKEATRDAWSGRALATGTRELRYALRALRRSPAFLAVAVATLAIGIGGATAVFTIIKGSLLRPLPAVADPDRLVSVERLQGTQLIAELSYPDYRNLRDDATTLAGLAAYNGTSLALEDRAGKTRAWVSYVSDNFFTVLGVRPETGRLFDSSGASADGAVAVLGYDLWQHRFAGAVNAIGATVQLDGHPFTVVGVAPRGFLGAMAEYPMAVWIPLAAGKHLSPPLQGYEADGINLDSRRSGWLRLVGRLAPNASVSDAQRDLVASAARLAAAYPTNRNRSVRVFHGAGMTADERTEVSRVPRLLAMAVALLLLIACGNVASLSLVRAAARRRELATRVALGASRAALVRQVGFEGAVIAVAAGLVGIAIAQALVRSDALVRTVVSWSELDLGIDGRVLAVALVASALTAILVSIVPALQVLRLRAGAVLKEGGSAVGPRLTRGRRALVAAQVGASLVLLSGAAMIFSAFHRVLAAEDAVDPRGLTTLFLVVKTTLREPARQAEFYRAVLDRAAVEPSIASAAVASTIPPFLFQWAKQVTVFRRGEEPLPGQLAGHETELGHRVSEVIVSRDFFNVARIPLLRGRAFTPTDEVGSLPVAIVSRRLAEALWPGEDPIGRFLSWPSVEGPPRAPLCVVGVAADTRDLWLSSEPPLSMYVPVMQHPDSNLILVARAAGEAPVPAATLARLVASVNPSVALQGGETVLDRLRQELHPQQTASAWIGAFGLIALLLAAIGLYGVVAQRVAQRTREFAVRAALGASPRGILATVLGEGVRLAAVGALFGGFGIAATVRGIQSVFSGVAAIDSRAALVATGALAVVMFAAIYVPARRAARLNPAQALRTE